jgi:uncharacterized RDD family membrane protein YckC
MSSVDPSAPQQSTPSPPPPRFAPPPSYWVPPPEKAGAPPGYRFAGFWIRFVAYVIDVFIASIPLIVLIFAAPSLTGAQPGRPLTPELSGRFTILLLVGFGLAFAYFPFFWWRGATPAMRLFKMRIVRTNDGSRLGLGRAILRYIGFILSGWALYIGLIWAAFDDRKQGWHDKLADSFVIRPI